MIKILSNITENRTASIQFEDGTFSRNIPLETGAPQDNSPSPVQYNIREQILLFKIELDSEIASVFNHFLPLRNEIFLGQPLVVNQVGGQQAFTHESNRETDNAEAFADDTTVFSLVTGNSLPHLKNSLQAFSEISGLKYIIEKSIIMPMGGGESALNPSLVDSGFRIADSITILGMNLKSDLSNLSDSHSVTILRIHKIINFWQRFNLSLPGRIGIVKNLVLCKFTTSAVLSCPPLNKLGQCRL